MRSVPAALAAAFAATAGWPVSAEDAAGSRAADLRCVVVMSAMLRDESLKASASAGLMYYVGRLEGREPQLELTGAVRRALGDFQWSDYRHEAVRCSDALKARSDGLKAMGESLQPRGVGR